MISMTYEAKSTTPRSRQRRRTEAEAAAILDALGYRLRGDRREKAFARIRRAKQPVAEAKRIVRAFSVEPRGDVPPAKADEMMDKVFDVECEFRPVNKEQRKILEDAYYVAINSGKVDLTRLRSLLTQCG